MARVEKHSYWVMHYNHKYRLHKGLFFESRLVSVVIIRKDHLNWRNISRLMHEEISALQQKCFLRGRGEPAHCDPCGIAQPTNNVPPCWPSSQLQQQLRLKIDNLRQSSRRARAFWKIPQPSLIHPLLPYIKSRSNLSFIQDILCIFADQVLGFM